MKTKKTKKLLGGVAIAAVSLGCLGLAGIANASTMPSSSDTSSSSASDNAPFYKGEVAKAETGSVTLTFNTSAAQGNSLSSHKLSYIQLGSYVDTGSSAFQVISSSQAVANAFAQFAETQIPGIWQSTAGTNFKAYDPSTDGDPLTWMINGYETQTTTGSKTTTNHISYLGSDLSGQSGAKMNSSSSDSTGTGPDWSTSGSAADWGAAGSADWTIRALANYLETEATSTGILGDATSINATTKTPGQLQDITTQSNGMQTGTWAAPAPGIYLILDQDGSNAAMPMIVATTPTTSGMQVPSNMADIVTDDIALKTQDPQAMPIKQFVVGGKLQDSDSATVGSSHQVEYQVGAVFPNFEGYQSYTYSFVDQPAAGLTLQVAGGSNLDIAGIPVSTLEGEPGASVVVTEKGPQTAADGAALKPSVTTASYGSGQSSPISDMTTLFGSGTSTQPASELKVTLNLAALQYIQAHGDATSVTVGGEVNSGSLSSYSVSATPTATPKAATSGQDTSQGIDQGKSSYTGQTSPAQYFGMTYMGNLNTAVSVPSTGSETAGENIASTVNNGAQSNSTNPVPLTSSGTYNGGSTSQEGNTGSTTQTGKSTNTGKTGPTKGVPTNTSTNAGLNWMKVWASGQVATGAEFQVQNAQGQYLYAGGDQGNSGASSSGSGWLWGTSQQAETFKASKLSSGTAADANGGLFQISGLNAGSPDDPVTYTVTEVKQADGAAPIKPTFKITLSGANAKEEVTPVNGYNLVNNTPDGNPFNSQMFNTVENVKSVTGLPLTGGAGILTGVIAAVLLFGTAGIVLVVYKRKKSQQD